MMLSHCQLFSLQQGSINGALSYIIVTCRYMIKDYREFLYVFILKKGKKILKAVNHPANSGGLQ